MNQEAKHFHFEVDEPYARKHNELIRDTRRLQWSAFFFGIVQILLGVGCLAWLGGDFGWIVFGLFAIFALVSFVLIAIIPRKVGNATAVYENYPLAPAIVAEVNPRDLVLLALVNISTNPEKEKLALCARTVSSIHGHKRAVGEKVPVVAVTGRRTMSRQQTWDQCTPVPIAWGTEDRKVLQKAVRAIQPGQWEKLQGLRKKLPEVKATRFDLLPLKEQ